MQNQSANIQLANELISKISFCHQQSKFSEMLLLSEKLCSLFPKYFFGYKAKSVALLELNQIDKNLFSAAKKAFELAPKDDYTVISNFGYAQIICAKTENDIFAGIKTLQRALQINPQFIDALNNLSAAMLKLNDYAAAKKYAEQSLKISQNNFVAWRLFGVACQRTDGVMSAYLATKKAFELNPLDAATARNLTIFCRDIGNIDEALIYAEHAINLVPSDLEMGYLKLLLNPYKHFQNENERIKTYENDIKIYAEKVKNIKPQKYFFHEKFKKNYRNLVEKNKNQKLRIGFVSGDFRRHAVSKFLLNLFENLNKKIFTTIAFSTASENQEDEITQQLRKNFNEWHNISYMNDEMAAKKIHDLKIQILFDLSGLTIGNRLGIFALKPAPIQISWIGWLGTTGIPTMDYFLADEFCVPSGEKYEKQFSEKVLKMPHIWEVLTPPDFPREIQKNFCESRGNENENFIFASFNNPNKVNAKTLDLWSEVLKKSPQNTEFHWFRGDFKEQDLQEKFLAEFAKRGVDLSKIKLAATFGSQEYFEKLQSVDLILDTITATGMTTTAEALSVGIPTLTCVGDCIQNRFSGTCINAIGEANLNKNFIFENENDFVNQAIFFAENPQKLNELKNGLAEKARKSPLCDAELFAKNFEIKMWEVWNNFLNS